jgi:N-methylhydantoinase A
MTVNATSKAETVGPGVSIGIDIGGTFTDVVCSTSTGTHILKVPTTRDDPGRAVLAALAMLQDRFAIAPKTITTFTHGTTIATNAVLERKGAHESVSLQRAVSGTCWILAVKSDGKCMI